MRPKIISVADLRDHMTSYISEAMEAPIVIARHGHTSLVLFNFEEYKRLKACDTRVAFRTSELPEDDAATFPSEYQGRTTPEYG